MSNREWEFDTLYNNKEYGRCPSFLPVMLNDPRVAVAQAVAKGILDISEVKEDCRALLEGLIAIYRQ